MRDEQDSPHSSTTAFRSGGHLSRFSSRHGRLSQAYLAERLRGADTYDRIAGYFRSSIFELVGEEISSTGHVRIVANADLDVEDIRAAQKVRDAKLFQKFVDSEIIVDSTINRTRYEKLYTLLTCGKVEVRVVPRTIAPFLHGKAGVVRGPRGAVAFMGSINETRAAWAHNYELVWEDSSPEGVEWVQAEFDELWRQSVALPDMVVEEIGRLARRYEVRVGEISDDPSAIAPAALTEAPIYRDGESLQPWQRAFVTLFLEHRATYGKARILLADEVGVGKTLSLAAAALISVLLGDGPVLILVPPTLSEQWQIELLDRLGMPSARWHSIKKSWIDAQGRLIKGRGAEDIARCPFAIGLVSTGLIVHGIDSHGRPKAGSEAEQLSRLKFGLVILDEAHKARGSQALGDPERHPNNLLKFLDIIATRSRHLILSTATPIQTSENDLWDLLRSLNRSAEFVLGNLFSRWQKPGEVMPFLTGERQLSDVREGWQMLTNPLPPASGDDLIADIRDEFEISQQQWFTQRFASDLNNPVVAAKVEFELTGQIDGLGYFQRSNPLIRHIVLRKRRDLERLGLIASLPVDVHPNSESQLPEYIFDGLSLRTTDAFDAAYSAVNGFVKAYGKRDKPAGFMKTLLLRRLCSSYAAGIATAQALLGRCELDDEAQEEAGDLVFRADESERHYLQTIIETLTFGEDPKLRAVRYFLDEHVSGSKSWRELGAIIFSQYYDTALWIGEALSAAYPGQVVALYAGAGKSRLLVDGQATVVERTQIKGLVASREVGLVVATDAACEGLNLQTLGTLINLDLPWNPSRLEQRIGRIKRFGQTRSRVDMANLTYAGTIDEQVYKVISERLKVSNDIFGSLPETIDADWIDDIETFEQRLRDYTKPRERFDPFKVKYANALADAGSEWAKASAVFARNDITDVLSAGWAEQAAPTEQKGSKFAPKG